MRRNDSHGICGSRKPSPPPTGYSRFASTFPREQMVTYLTALELEGEWLEARANVVKARMKEVRDVINRWTWDDWLFLGLEPPILPEELHQEGGAR